MIEAITESGLEMRIPKVVGKYILEREIGKGASSVVFEARHKLTNVVYACKAVSREFINANDTLMHLEQELRIHMTLKHPHICKIEDVIYQPSCIFVFMEYCANGDMFQWLNKMPLDINLRFVAQIISAISYLHERGIAHQDIKPENILIDQNWDIKIADFGNCDSTKNCQKLSFYGTVDYAPPEVFQQTIFDKKAIDIWQIGILFFEMFTGYLPWGTDKSVLPDQITGGLISIPPDVPFVVQKLIKSCAVVNPKERATIEEVKRIEENKKKIKKAIVSSGRQICWKSTLNLRKDSMKEFGIPVAKSFRAENGVFVY